MQISNNLSQSRVQISNKFESRSTTALTSSADQQQLRVQIVNNDADVRVQINNKFEFYDEIDLSRPGRNYAAEDTPSATDLKYKLLSVLVHAGQNQGGHYWAYVRPHGDKWYKFDDETVREVEQSEAIEGQWGQDEPRGLGAFSQAHLAPCLSYSAGVGLRGSGGRTGRVA